MAWPPCCSKRGILWARGSSTLQYLEEGVRVRGGEKGLGDSASHRNGGGGHQTAIYGIRGKGTSQPSTAWGMRGGPAIYGMGGGGHSPAIYGMRGVDQPAIYEMQ